MGGKKPQEHLTDLLSLYKALCSGEYRKEEIILIGVMWDNWHPCPEHRCLCVRQILVQQAPENAVLDLGPLGVNYYSVTFNYLVLNQKNHSMNSSLFCGLLFVVL